jgi:hypothetical protein
MTNIHGMQPTKAGEERAIRKAEGLLIDPATAEIMWEFGRLLDPYGVLHETKPEMEDNIGKIWFTRAPESDIWVEFRDLPESTRKAIRRRLRDTPPEECDHPLPWE